MASTSDTRDELFLIDGNSLAYRAFFALPESIATSTGFPTNAIFGFASMLVKILTEHGQRATIVAWDRGHSGRREVYADYKAQRSSRPDLFKQQWPHLEPLVESFGYANVSLEGYEADDVIATLAEQAKAKGIPVKIVTGDRDSFQLVDDGVEIMATARGITETRTYDRQGVIDRYGIPPELVPDFIGLKGDTSDNIPGVPGIGDKTAAQLLNEYGDLEGVLAHAGEIRARRRRENLIAHAEDARISKQLATMRRDLPVAIDLAAIAGAEPDRSRLRETFREFELRDPLRRLEEVLGEGDAAAPRPATLPLPGGGHHALSDFTPGAFAAETSMFLDWYLPHAGGGAPGAAMQADYASLWDDLIGRLAGKERGWVLLDFHSPNLLWLSDREGIARLGIIDSQDLMIGPSAYDVASLCQDARATVSPPLEAELVARYAAARCAADPGFDIAAFEEAYAILTVQRATKILGIFARLADGAGRTGYLRHNPRLREYLDRSLAHPAMTRYALWYRRHIPPLS